MHMHVLIPGDIVKVINYTEGGQKWMHVGARGMKFSISEPFSYSMV